MRLLNNISGHDDLVKLSREDRTELCGQIRQFLVENISHTGGHLASNLGVVELTVAIETVFNTNIDRLVFDVGHQSYVHKLLTGRQADFAHLRQFGGMAGFPKPSESDSDAFVAGHASSSVSIALGMARARTLLKQDHNVIALIGDGATTGGLSYEGLNDAADSREPMIIILNDNEMSIDRNVGGVAKHLSRLRTKERYLGMKNIYRSLLRKIPGGKAIYRFTRSIKDWIKRMILPTTVFENMGLTYMGPVDGHNTEELIRILRVARDLKKPVLVHVLTHKGHGYAPAEHDPSKFHGIGKFDPDSGKTLSSGGVSFSSAFGAEMIRLANEDPRICAITAAMPGGTGLLDFKQAHPDRLFDVGIAEEHAVSMAGGLAKQGMIPVVAIYSTFLQRAYDQILQDVAMLNLHVVFAVDRAGLVGEDGETHHGVFDMGFLRHAPGMTVLCPASCAELSDMLRWAAFHHFGPVAVRYPRGGDRGYVGSAWVDTKQSPVVCHRSGKDATIITYGTILKNAMDAAELLEQENINTVILRLLSLSPLNTDAVLKMLPDHGPVVILEEANSNAGIYNELACAIQQAHPERAVYAKNLGDQYVTHGGLDALYRSCGLDSKSLADFVKEVHSL